MPQWLRGKQSTFLVSYHYDNEINGCFKPTPDHDPNQTPNPDFITLTPEMTECRHQKKEASEHRAGKILSIFLGLSLTV